MFGFQRNKNSAKTEKPPVVRDYTTGSGYDPGLSSTILRKPDSAFKSEELKALLEITQLVNSSLDLDTVLDRVMDQIILLSKAERGFLMLLGEDDEPEFKVARNMDQQSIDASTFDISRTIVNQVIGDGEAIITSNAQKDPRFDGNQSIVSKNLRSILCVPFKVKEEVIGAVYIDNRCQSGSFNEHDRDLMTAFANQAALSIENARLHGREIQQRLKTQELDTAAKIQRSFLPDVIPTDPDWEFAARWEPMKEVAGDFYDFHKLPDGRLALVMADVSDKGVPAALVMSMCITTIRFAMELNLSPDVIVKRNNHSLMNYHKAGMLATVFIGYLDLRTGALTYVNAGHNPPIIHRRANQTFDFLESTATLLGFFEDIDCEVREATINPGDSLIMYTDGITEELNAHDEMFGEERLEALLAEKHELPPDKLIHATLSEVERFSEGEGVGDDKTISVAKRLITLS